MSFLKVSGIMIGILLMCSVGYFFLPQDIEVEKDSVIDHILSQDLAKADSTLEKYRRMISFSEWSLYKGYIERAKGNLDESSKILNQALVHPADKVDTIIIKEIFLNRMLNAYLEQEPKKLSLVISQGRKLFAAGEQDWVNIFRGIEAY